MIDYDALATRVKLNGGFTVDLQGREPTSGFAVALPGHERIARVRSSADIADAIYSYVVHHGNALRRDGRYLGGWLYEGRLFLDVSEVVPTIETNADGSVVPEGSTAEKHLARIEQHVAKLIAKA